MKAVLWLLVALFFGIWGLIFAIDPQYGGRWWAAAAQFSVAAWALGLCVYSCEAFVKRRSGQR
jgi:hypothetical protein